MAGGGATSSGAIDGKSPARVDMLAADDGAGGAAAPSVPGGGVAPRGPAGVPRGTAPSGSGVPSTGPKIRLVGGDPVVGRYALGKQVGIHGGRAEHMLAHRQRHERLVAVADFDGGRALSGMTHARIVAGAANRKR